MADYIDKAVVNKMLFDFILELSRTNAGREAYAVSKALAMVQHIPVADVVEVVRCMECELWNDWDHSGRKEFGNFVCSCACWSNEDGYVVYTAPEDYCIHGERKDGAE